MKKLTLEVNIWDYMDIEGLNERVDELLEGDEVAMDIGYECKSISKSGYITLNAKFDVS